MQVDHVVSILESLANGIDPATDTPLPQHPFQSPDVIRALFTAASLLTNGTSAAPRARARRPAAAGRRWTDEEDAEVCREYDAGMSFMDIAQKHSRTTGGVMSRLAKLGRIDPETLSPRLRELTVASLQ